jgi:phenylacetate-CoA ligase
VEFRISPARIGRLEEERQAQNAWTLRHPAVAPIIEGYLRREFLEPQAASDLEAMELARIVGYARSRVPFYRDHDAWRDLQPGPIDREKLATLPVINKTDLRESFNVLKALRLPKGERVLFETHSSGTSGTPARVLFGHQAGIAFGLLTQRLHRWGRLNPHLKQAAIRQARVLPKGPNGAPLKDGEVQRINGWMYVRDYFHTGPQVAITRGNTLEFQLEWLRAEQPAYLVSSPGIIESLVYAAQGKPVDSLLSLRAVAATLTEAVRQQIEAATGLPILQPYGLNEIGAVASRCAAGRYHVNAEHCVVEVVDEQNQPCKAGEFGRVLATGLTNVAMPLIRYDTGDVAEAVSGECACGRTLPAIGRIRGRYRPLRLAPEGTTHRMDLLFYALRTLPLEMLHDLREYQLHQYQDGSFELRLHTRGEPDARLLAALRDTWNKQAGDVPLNIIRVDAIARTAGQKTQDFTSAFFPSLHAGE